MVCAGDVLEFTDEDRHGFVSTTFLRGTRRGDEHGISDVAAYEEILLPRRHGGDYES